MRAWFAGEAREAWLVAERIVSRQGISSVRGGNVICPEILELAFGDLKDMKALRNRRRH
jgi:hypothetical protein